MPKSRIPQVTDAQITAAFTGVSNDVDPSVAARSGSDDKVAAAEAETKAPQVRAVTPDGADWLNQDSFGLKIGGIYGQRGRYALRHIDIQRHAQFRGESANSAYLETVVHGPDPSAPNSMVCTSCGEEITSFVRTAMINEDGDLRRDQDGNVTYRGQFVVTGKPMTVHAGHTGDCLYKLRNARNRRKTLESSGKSVADLLPSQSFDQANARLAGLNGHFAQRRAEGQAFQKRLGFTNEPRGSNDRDEGVNRGQFTPSTPRGHRRAEKRQRGWADAS